jgi:hypothetical protein
MFEKQISAAITSELKKFVDSKIKSIGIAGDHHAGLDELVKKLESVIEKCEAAFHNVDLSNLLAGFTAIGHGLETVLQAVDAEKLRAALVDCATEIGPILTLAGEIFAAIKPASMPIAPAPEAAPEAPQA